MLHAVNHDVVHSVELSGCHGIVAITGPGFAPGHPLRRISLDSCWLHTIPCVHCVVLPASHECDIA
jgi:hypothetical protein